jgi:hypothetical protein
MTALPVKPPIPPEQALLFLDEIPRRLTPVALTADDYFRTMHSAAERGLTGGRIYDARDLHCARQLKARTIYTWNLRPFSALAPDLADRMCTP